MEKGPLDKTVMRFGLPAVLRNQLGTLQITKNASELFAAVSCVGAKLTC